MDKAVAPAADEGEADDGERMGEKLEAVEEEDEELLSEWPW